MMAQDVLIQLGWTLVHFLWQGTVLACMLALTLRLLRGASSDLRYGLACLTLVLMSVVPILTFLSMSPIPKVGAVVPISSGVSSPTTQVARGLTILKPNSPTSVATPTEQVMPWLVGLWLLGVIFFAARAGGGLRFALLMTTRDTHAVPESWLNILEDLRHRLKIHRPVGLLLSSRVAVPTAVGFLKPTVLLPVGISLGLTPTDLQAVLAHELAHIRRNDYLVNLAQVAIETLLFYHPAVWWVSNQIRIERENCCDDRAVATLANPLAYARALTQLESLRHIPAPALAANGGSLLCRIRRLVKPERPVRGAGLLSAMLVLLALTGLGFSSHFLGWQELTHTDTVLPMDAEVLRQVHSELDQMSEGMRRSYYQQYLIDDSQDLALRRELLAEMTERFDSDGFRAHLLMATAPSLLAEAGLHDTFWNTVAQIESDGTLSHLLWELSDLADAATLVPFAAQHIQSDGTLSALLQRFAVRYHNSEQFPAILQTAIGEIESDGTLNHFLLSLYNQGLLSQHETLSLAGGHMESDGTLSHLLLQVIVDLDSAQTLQSFEEAYAQIDSDGTRAHLLFQLVKRDALSPSKALSLAMTTIRSDGTRAHVMRQLSEINASTRFKQQLHQAMNQIGSKGTRQSLASHWLRSGYFTSDELQVL